MNIKNEEKEIDLKISKITNMANSVINGKISKNKIIIYRSLVFTWSINSEKLKELLKVKFSDFNSKKWDFYFFHSLLIDVFYKFLCMIEALIKIQDEKIKSKTWLKKNQKNYWPKIILFKEIRKYWIHPWNLYGGYENDANIAQYSKTSVHNWFEIIIADETFSDNAKRTHRYVRIYNMKKVVLESIDEICIYLKLKNI